nr:redoxin domain-containing protein [Ardenticatena sp.]
MRLIERWPFVLFVLIALLIVACRVPTSTPQDPVLAQNGTGHPLVGTKVPATTVYTLDGEAVMLDTLGAGKPRLINFWATWCPPCKKEMPELQALYEEGLLVIGIDVEEGPAVVEQFLRTFEPPITYPTYISKDASVEKAYRLLGLPTSWLVDTDGTIRMVWTGQITREMIEEQLSRIR